MNRFMCAAMAALALAVACCAQEQYSLVGDPLTVEQDEVLVSPEEDWTSTVIVPAFAEDERLVLHMQARLHVEGGGGCNWVLQVLLGGAVLDEAIGAPRLLNKPPDFDLTGTDFHFDWFSHHHQAWMTMFSDSYERDMTDAEDDHGFLWDVTYFAEPGERLELRIAYAQKELPRIMGKPAPLAVRDVWLGVMPADEVERLRAEALQGGAAWREVPIQADVPADAPAGERPYELEWSGRPESPAPQVTFEDLSGWSASVRGEAEVTLGASRAHHAWRERGLAVTCRGDKTNATLELRPPEPIAIEGEWDAIDLWAYVDLGGQLHATRAILPVAVIEDSRGVRHEVRLGYLRGRYWYVTHGKLTDAQSSRIEFPARFVALLLDRCNQEKPGLVHLESIAFYREQREPYAVSPRPESPSFPTGEDAMLPTPPEGARNSTAPAEIRELACRTDEWALFYFPAEHLGPFAVGAKLVTLRENRPIMLEPVRGGGILFDTPAGPVPTNAENSELIERTVVGETLNTRWRFAAEGVEAEFTVDYRIRGATLVMDVRCPGGAAMGTRFGVVRIDGDEARGVEVPYLQMGTPPGPLVAYNDHVFVSALYDWPNCDFSLSEVTPDPNAEGGLSINGGSTYLPLTNGRRNDLHDRIIVTISPEFHDVLPNCPNPRASNLEEAARYMYVMGGGPTPNQWRSMARYGLKHCIAMHFAGIWWRRAGEGFSMRHRPRPEMAIEELREYTDFVRSLGYPFGVLLEYRDFFPMNEWWDPNLLSLTPAGDWATSWSGHYGTKPNAMPMLARRTGELIESRYPLDAVYMDTHTNQSLTARDYEAGVPGAGSGPAQALCNGETILEVKRLHGIVCSEGIYRWLYAGLSDMDYATWPIRSVLPAERDILPDFDLLKIHSRNIGTGMGYNPRPFFGQDNMAPFYSDPGERLAPPQYHQYIAATIAHGHSPILGYSYFPPMHRMIHYYAMLQGPAQEWLTDTVAGIERHDGERFVSTSEAIRRDLLGIGRIRIAYSRGLVVCVNYNHEEPWTVELDGRSYVLPPMGWAAAKPGEIESFSALIDGRRVDYTHCPEYVYLSSPEGEATHGGITVDGAVLVHRTEDGLRVIPCGHLGAFRTGAGQQYPYHYDRFVEDVPEDRGTPVLRIDLREVAPELADGAQVVGRDFEGDPTEARVSIEDGILRIEPDVETVDYVAVR